MRKSNLQQTTHSNTIKNEDLLISHTDSFFNIKLDQLIQEKTKLALCPGTAFSVVIKGETVFQKSYGSAVQNKNIAINDSTVFRIGSLSKGFAGILATLLIEKGYFKLNDPIVKYIPDFKIKAKNTKDDSLRIWHILSHTTGITEHAYSNLIDENIPLEKIYTSLNKIKPIHTSGQSFAYQNAIFGLIEKIIFQTTGLPYNQALEYFLFSPLNMCEASCQLSNIKSHPNHCLGHKPNNKHTNFVSIPLGSHYYNVVSAGGINASINDMNIWLKAMMGYYPNIVSEEARSLAFNAQIITTHTQKYFSSWTNLQNSFYGLGWRILKFKDRTLIHHGGMVNGFRAEIAFDLKDEVGIVILLNSTCAYSNYAVPKFYEWYDEYYKKL